MIRKLLDKLTAPFAKGPLAKIINTETIIYILVGGLTTLVNWVVAFIFNNIIGCSLTVITNMAAWIAAVAFAYVTNNTWVFRIGFEGGKKEFFKICKFVGSRAATGLIEIGGCFLFVDILKFSYWPVKILVSLIIFVLNYLCSKLLIFIKKKPEKTEEQEVK